MPTTSSPESELAAVWFLAARTMFIASGREPRPDEASAGLYAQAILGLDEQVCLAAKRSERLRVMTLVDCIGAVGRLPREMQEKIITGVMMIAYADRRMARLEVRWASMLASAAGLTAEDFQRLCGAARVIAAMLRPQTEDRA